jgi:hypothetical protein
MRFNIIPLVGVGPVLLGMRREDVRVVMGESPREFRKSQDSVYTTDAFHDSAFQVFYSGATPAVEFIELSRGGKVEAYLDGIDVFGSAADDLVAKIGKRASFNPNDPELGNSYEFPELELALWRPFAPCGDADPDGRFFSTVSIGVRGYFSARAG